MIYRFIIYVSLKNKTESKKINFNLRYLKKVNLKKKSRIGIGNDLPSKHIRKISPRINSTRMLSINSKANNYHLNKQIL